MISVKRNSDKGDLELYNKWMKQDLRKGDIIITTEAPMGELYGVCKDEKFILFQRVISLRIKEKYDWRYVSAYTSVQKFQSEIRGKGTGSTVKGISQKELLETTIEIPSEKKQNEIGKLLDLLIEKTD